MSMFCVRDTIVLLEIQVPIQVNIKKDFMFE